MRPLLVILLLAAAFPTTALAQRIVLNVTGLPVVFPSPTGADYIAGFVQSPTVTMFTVDPETGPNDRRTTTVSVRCATPCPSSGSKPVGTLQWRRADDTVWRSLTTTNQVVESRPIHRPSLNDPWSNMIVWRFLLDWDSDLPGPTTTFNIVFTMTVTTP